MPEPSGPEPVQPEAPEASPTITEIFTGFFGIGIVGFGGVLPWARRMIVEQREWLSGPEFTDLLALCQFLPGANIVNMAVALGSRFRGIPGAAAAVAGLMIAPMGIVILLGTVYAQYSGLPAVRHGFAGLAAAASGLVIAMSVRIAWPLRSSRSGMLVALIAILAIAVLRLPLLPTMAVLVPASIALLRRFPA